MRDPAPVAIQGNPAAPHSGAQPPRIPGETGIWILILGEMTVFAALFASFLHYRALAVAEFATARAELNKATAIANTLILLTSSLFVAMGVRAAGRGQADAAPRLFAAGLCCGLAFVALKGLEYHDLISRGIALDTNGFFSFYFGLTILHLIHVIAGSVILAVLLRFTRKPLAKPSHFVMVESAGCWWHMVDLLWIIIFPLLYLVE
jgi:nitric oxide reductase NorE protein